MGDRRPKKRKRPATGDSRPGGTDPFAEAGLDYADFDVQAGGGKSFLSGQRVVWMTVTHLPTGRRVSGKVGTTKKGAARQEDALLRELLRSFRRP